MSGEPGDAPSPPVRPSAPDPEIYDSPRARIAREKGLPGPYIPGGDDPEPEAALQEERKYGRLLLFMVIAIVAAGFILGLVIAIAQGAR
ncbi:MAG: hypothetical protein ACJ761_11160 [Chloroflexota bacterium]